MPAIARRRSAQRVVSCGRSGNAASAGARSRDATEIHRTGPGALPKLIAHPSATEGFDRIGFGDWFRYLIGSLELAGAIALLIPLLSGLAGLAFIGLMTGAFITQVTVFDGENAATPLIVMVLVGLVAWGRRGQTTRLIRLVSRGPRARGPE